jgi:hypothetical protein
VFERLAVTQAPGVAAVGGRSHAAHPARTDPTTSPELANLFSSARQDQLLRAGFLFEACVAQAAMIEALCAHYLMLLKKVSGKTIQPNLQKRLSAGRITFGQLKEAVGHTGLLEPKAFEALAQYVDERNQLVHHMVGGMVIVDLKRFYDRGRRLGEQLGAPLMAALTNELRRGSLQGPDVPR